MAQFNLTVGRRVSLRNWHIARLLSALLLIGCDSLPRDSAGALERVSGGELRVGVAENPPWVHWQDGAVSGLEPELIESWAKSINARVLWRRGSEAELVEALNRRELDVMAAGLDSKTPYAAKLALTQPYVEVEERGKKKKHLLAVTPGESALLFALDRFLAAQDRDSLKRRALSLQRRAAP